MASIIIDTHVIIWYFREPEKLSELAINSIDNAIFEGHCVYISAISIIEIIFLVEKRRLPLIALERLLTELNNYNSRLTLVPVDLNIAQTMQQIDRQIVPEMPDRIIAATALYLGLPLVTRDLKIQALSNIQTIW
jgi:PIN domain nuclease of toxin-antitoxin system